MRGSIAGLLCCFAFLAGCMVSQLEVARHITPSTPYALAAESACECDAICEALVSTTTVLPNLAEAGAAGQLELAGAEAGTRGPSMESAEAVRVFPLSNITFDAWRCDCPSAVDDVAAHPEGPFWTHRAVQPEWDLEQALGSQAMHVAGGWNGTVMAMMTNLGEVDLVENLLCSLRRVGVNKYVVFATDDQAEAALRARHINTFPMKRLNVKDWTDGETGHIGFGHKGRVSFNRFVRAKIEVQDKVLTAGFHLLFSDVDVVWTANVLPQLLAYPAQGYFMKEADEYAKLTKLRSRHEANTGFFMLQHGAAQRALHKRMYQIERQRDVHDDQKLMNHALELKDHRALKNYLPRVPISNGCLLNALARVGQLPDGRKNIPEEARVGARVKEIKVAHLNCAVNKLVKLMMYCKHEYWQCRNMPFMDPLWARKLGNACAHLNLTPN